MLPPEHRLRRSEDFRSVIRGGRRVGGRYVVTHVLAQSTRGTRVGFVVSKAVGNAVRRNRVKRRMRAISAEMIAQERVGSAADVVFRATPRASEASYAALRHQMYRSLEKIGASS